MADETNRGPVELGMVRAEVAALRAEVVALRLELECGPLAAVAHRERRDRIAVDVIADYWQEQRAGASELA
jgi:hypothetical protein